MLWYSQMLCYCSYYVQPVAYLRVNPQVEEVPEYLKTIPTLLLLLYCTYNALSKCLLSYINKTFIHYSFLLYGVRPTLCQIVDAKPSIPRRKSVYPVAIKFFSNPTASLSMEKTSNLV